LNTPAPSSVTTESARRAGSDVKLDLDYLEDKTRYAQSTPTTALSKWELALLISIAKAALDAGKAKGTVPLIDSLERMRDELRRAKLL
jgi:hypothetical protein